MERPPSSKGEDTVEAEELVKARADIRKLNEKIEEEPTVYVERGLTCGDFDILNDSLNVCYTY